MKLLELLVKERPYVGKSWQTMGQCETGEVLITRDAVTVKLEGLFSLPVADDWQTAIVTKEQYDSACKLVDDGYTLWFGGECPVPADSKVTVVMDGSYSNNSDFVRASDWRWEWEDGLTNIIAYKFMKPEGTREPIGFNCRCVAEELPDVVNHPSHYTNGKVECIDAIESATVGKTGIEAVCVANVIKYLWRYEDKNGLEDIKKAQWYLNKLIEVVK